MKAVIRIKSICTMLLIWGMASAHAASIQTGGDDFNDNSADPAKWALFHQEGAAALSETNQWLEYTSASTAESFIEWAWNGDGLSYTQDWAVAVDVAALFDGTELANKNVGIGMAILTDAGYWFNLDFSMDEYGPSVGTYAGDPLDNETLNAWGGFVSTNELILKIAFDAQTKKLYSSYSIGGDFIALTNYSTVSFGMTDALEFTPTLLASSEAMTVPSGKVHLDNFRIYESAAPLSNHVEIVSLEYSRDFGRAGDPSDDGYWYDLGVETSTDIQSISMHTDGGIDRTVTNASNNGSGLDWELSDWNSTTPYDAALDGDIILTFGFTDGSYRSSIFPYTKDDGTTPIPAFVAEPGFTSPNPLADISTNASTMVFQWATPPAGANFFELGDYTVEDESGIYGIYATGITDVLGKFPPISGPLSTTQSDLIPLTPGTNAVAIYQGFARTAYNIDGIGYAFIKLAENYHEFFVTDLDTDNDGLPDAWEIQFFGSTNAINGGSSDDWDGDTRWNSDEYIAGTDPTNSASVFAITQSAPIPSGFVLNWAAIEGRAYSVLWTDSLTNNFQTLKSNITPPQNSYTDAVHAAEGGGFYNLKVELEN